MFSSSLYRLISSGYLRLCDSRCFWRVALAPSSGPPAQRGRTLHHPNLPWRQNQDEKPSNTHQILSRSLGKNIWNLVCKNWFFQHHKIMMRFWQWKLWPVSWAAIKDQAGGTWRSYLFSSEVSGQWSEDPPNLPPFKLSIHKKSGSLRTSNWCPYIRIAWHHLNLPHGKIHVAQDTPFAQGSPPPPFAPGLRPPVGPRPLRPRGYFSWNCQCFHDCHDISCLSELCHTIFNIFNLTMTSLTRTHTSSLPIRKLVSTLSFVACVSR